MTDTDRRQFLKAGAAGIAANAVASCGQSNTDTEAHQTIDLATANWGAIKQQFELSDDIIHEVAAKLAKG